MSPKVAAIVDRRAAISVTGAGYVDLGTASGYLTGLKAGHLGITMWVKPNAVNLGVLRYWSAETEADTGAYFYMQGGNEDKPKIIWTGDTGADSWQAVSLGALHNVTYLFEITGTDTVYGYIDGVEGGGAVYVNLADVHATLITLGARAYTGKTAGVAGIFGPFAVLDLSDTTIDSSAKKTALAKAIYVVGPNAEQMRRAIMRHNINIKGKLWKCNDIPKGQTQATHTTVERYDIVTGNKEGTTSSTISAGTGVIELS